jgi:predicted peptidase
VNQCLTLLAITAAIWGSDESDDSLILGPLPQQEVIDRFESHRLRLTSPSGKQRELIYRLFAPAEISSEQQYPLIVWLHGYGKEEFEQLGYGHLRHTHHLLGDADAIKEHEFYLLALQCPLDQRGFYATAEEGLPEPGEAVIQVIQDLINARSIDPHRITLVGISGGGSAAWEMAMRYPEIFAGVAPLGSGGADLTRIEKLADVPVWAFHAIDDLSVASDGDIASVEALNSEGGSAHLTLIEGNDHDCWRFAFRDYRLKDWLLAQDRSATFNRPPGYVPFTSTQLVVQIGLPAIFVLVIWAEFRRRRRARDRASSNSEGVIVHR